MGVSDSTGSTLDAVLVGRRLRQLRRERQLSQAQLGGDRFTGSYVSHLEKGRRRLTMEMVDYFGARLQVDAASLLAADDDPAAPAASAGTLAQADRVLAFQEVQRAFTQHQFARAARAADEGMRSARARGDEADAWSLTLMRARALFEDGQYHQAAELAHALVDQGLAQGLPHLQVDALLVAARSARAGGELTKAALWARQARTVVDTVDSADLRAETYAVLIGALMESDALDEAVAASAALAATVDRVESDHVRGLAEWIVGNVEFLTGAVEEGARRHGEAATLLRPQVDLRLWGRFRKASAEMRLQNNMTDDVLELLNQAGDALRIVGNASDLSELRLDEARLWLLEGDLSRARGLVEHTLGDSTLQREPHLRAAAHALRGDIEEEEGGHEAASASYLRAALAYEEAGSYRRSVHMWRLHAATVDSPAGKCVKNVDSSPQDGLN